MCRDEDGDALIAGEVGEQLPKILRASGSTPEVGSSRIRISGSWTTATARDRRWRMPRGSPAASASTCSARPKAANELADPALLDPAAYETAVHARQDSAHRQLAVEREGLRHVADAFAQGEVGRIDRPVEQPRLALARRQEAGQHLDGRRLAAAVRAEEPEDLAAFDLEADMVDRGEVPEAAREIVRRDRRLLLSRRSRRYDELFVTGPQCLGQQGDKALLEGDGAGTGLDLRRRARGKKTAAIHGQQPIEALGLLHIGGRRDHAHAGTSRRGSDR